MFFGSFEYNIDEKGRLMIPTRFRSEIGDTLYLLKGFDGCISLYKKEDFEAYTKKISNLAYEKSKTRDYIRILFEEIELLTIDKVGRILIPTKVLKGYDIGKNVLLLGAFDHLEIWDINKWNAYKEEKSKNFEVSAEELLSSKDED